MTQKIKHSSDNLAYYALNYTKRTLFNLAGTRLFCPKPINIYLTVGSMCNSRCVMCHNWKKRTHNALSFSDWKKIMDNLYSWLGSTPKINISGGEVLLPGVMRQVVDYSIKKFPLTGITSNGFLISEKEAQRLIEMDFANINISIDGMTKKTVNVIRGQPFAFDLSRKAVIDLIKERKKRCSKTKIMLKTVVMGLNYRELPELVQWTKDIGADGIYFQPVEPIYASDQSPTQLKKSPLWIKSGNAPEALAVFDMLVEMKEKGYPIVNEVSNLEYLKTYFELVPDNTNAKFNQICRIDTTSLFIFADGNTYYCPKMQPIGDALKIDLKGMVNLPDAWQRRRMIRNCNNKECLATCVVEKSLPQLIKLYFFLNKK